MNKINKKSWLKTIITIFVMAFSLILIVACDTTTVSDQSLVNEAKENFEFMLSSGETLNSVTKNFNLDSKVTVGETEITITWKSSDNNVISISGSTARVTRPTDENKEVRITATFKLNDAEGELYFDVTVIREIPVADALAAIELVGLDYDEVTERYTTIVDITLPTTSLGYDVDWISSNENVIDTDGTVTRPSWDGNDAVVQLTASINDEERSFIINVPKIEEKPTSAKLQDAFDALLIPGLDVNIVRDDLELLSEVGGEGVTVTWVSSNVELVGHDGKIVDQPDEQTEFTMTATLSLDGESITKVFDLMVAAGLPLDFTGSIAEAIIEAEDVDDKFHAQIEDATIVALTKDGFIITDASEKLLFVYLKAVPNAEKFVVGNVYNVRGSYTTYYGTPQLQDWDDMIVKVYPSDGNATSVNPVEVTSISNYVASLVALENETGDPYNKTNPLEMQYLEITAKVRVQGNGDYDVLLVDIDYDGPNINTSTTAPNFNNNAIMIYYQSNIEAIRVLDGLTITAKFYLNARRTNNNVYAVVFTGVADDIELILTPEEEVSYAMNATTQPTQILKEDVTLLLPVKHENVDIEWEVLEGASLIDLLTGNIALPVTGNQLLKLQATFTLGDLVETKVFEIEVGEPNVLDIRDAKDADLGYYVKIKGVVTGTIGNNQIGIQDESGAMVLYGKMLSGVDFGVGDLITVLGKKDYYNELHQIASYEVLEKEAGIVPEFSDLNSVDLTKEALLPYQSMFVSLDNMIVTGYKYTAPAGSSAGNVTMVLERIDGEKISFRWDTRVAFTGSDALTTLKNGDIVNVVGAPIAWFNGAQIAADKDGQIVISDNVPDLMIATLASRNVKLDKTSFLESEIITLPATIEGFADVTVVWSLKNSDDQDFVDIDTGSITVVDGEFHEVTLIATVTKGGADVLVEFELSIGEKQVSEQVLYYIDFESGKQTGYLRKVNTTLGVDGGLSWYIDTDATSSSGLLWNFIEADGPLDVRHGSNVARLDGRNLTSITSVSIPNVTKVEIDAKVYSTQDKAKLAVYTKGDGDEDFVLLEDLGLTRSFQTFILEVNKTNVQIRLVGSGERSNFDNLTIYGQGEEASSNQTFDFTKLSDAPSYVKIETELTVNAEEGGSLALIRNNSSINNSKDNSTDITYKGIVLAINNSTNWGSPYLQTAGKVAGLVKVEFEVYNWVSDASYNLNYANKIVVQTSVDGLIWEDQKDFKADWNKEKYALNTLTVELDEPSDVYVRLYVETVGDQTGNHLRLIVSSLQIWTDTEE